MLDSLYILIGGFFLSPVDHIYDIPVPIGTHSIEWVDSTEFNEDRVVLEFDEHTLPQLHYSLNYRDTLEKSMFINEIDKPSSYHRLISEYQNSTYAYEDSLEYSGVYNYSKNRFKNYVVQSYVLLEFEYNSKGLISGILQYLDEEDKWSKTEYYYSDSLRIEKILIRNYMSTLGINIEETRLKYYRNEAGEAVQEEWTYWHYIDQNSLVIPEIEWKEFRITKRSIYALDGKIKTQEFYQMNGILDSKWYFTYR